MEVVRQSESAADACSLDMLVAAQYDPVEAIRVFDHLKEELSVDDGPQLPSSGYHPSRLDRVNALERRLATVDTDSGTRMLGTDAYDRQIRSILMLNARSNSRYGRYQRAIKDLKRYLALEPRDARAHHLLGETYRQLGGKSRLKDARACYQQAIQLDGSYAAPHKALGILLFKEGRKHLAQNYFKVALALSPDDKDSAYIAGYLAECLQ